MLQEISNYISARYAHTSSQQEMSSRLLDSSTDHEERVRRAEADATVADEMRYDFITYRLALKSLEKYFQDLWCTMKLDPNIGESLGALLTEQKKHSEATSLVLDSVVSRYDRFLNLVSYLHPHSNECLIENGTVAELHQYPDG
jgi:hypothetical protein